MIELITMWMIVFYNITKIVLDEKRKYEILVNIQLIKIFNNTKKIINTLSIPEVPQIFFFID